jgi:hypothetical protein
MDQNSRNYELYKKFAVVGSRVFLDETGLTMAEANHKANMLLEKSRVVASKLDRLRAYTQTVDLGQGPGKTINGTKEDFEKLALETGLLFQGSAWLREAIKAKRALLSNIENSQNNDYLSNNATLEKIELPVPIQKWAILNHVSMESILDTFTVAERTEYLALEAKAAALGKLIHEDGSIAKLRKDALSFEESVLIELKYLGTMSTFIAKNDLLYDANEVDAAFMRLQEQHRSFEAKLNWYKARIQNETSKAQQEAIAKHSEEQAVFDIEYNKEVKAYNDEFNRVKAANQLVINALGAEKLRFFSWASGLKIVVPNNLKELFDSINSEA